MAKKYILINKSTSVILFAFLFFGGIILGGIVQAQSPGGVSTNNILWLKADAGITGGSPDVSNWADQSGSANHAVGQAGANPDLISNGINFNPTIDFDFEMFNLNGLSAGNNFDFFIVIDPDNTAPKGFFESASAGQLNHFRNDGSGRIEIWNQNPSLVLSVAAKPNLLNFDVDVNPNRSITYYRNSTNVTSVWCQQKVNF